MECAPGAGQVEVSDLTGVLGFRKMKAMARQQRPQSPAGLRASDRGSQYASETYRAVLREHGFVGSMSRRGNPYDNAKAESFMT